MEILRVDMSKIIKPNVEASDDIKFLINEVGNSLIQNGVNDITRGLNDLLDRWVIEKQQKLS
jgi:hypothetical protein